MASHVSLVDDPEKHFLGNLLDEDPNISPPLLNRGSCSSPGAIPPVSVISGVGPISTNSLLRSYWPEPPPPYSPPIQVENHHHYPVTTAKIPPRGYAVNRLSETSPNQGNLLRTNESLIYEGEKAVENQKGSTKGQHPCSLDTPLSKPPLSFLISHLTKFIFGIDHLLSSYRDVAARNDQNTCNDSSVQQNKKLQVQLDLDSRSCTAKTRNVVVRGSSSSTRMNRDRKPKSEQGVDFQKITRKKVVAKKEKVLQVLASKTSKRSHAENVLVAKCDRGVGAGTVIDVARPKRTIDITEKKKQAGSTNTVEQSLQRRRTIHEPNEYGWIEKTVVITSIVSGWIEFVFRWILNILMGVCLQVYDVASIRVLTSSARHVSLRRFLRLREPEQLMWGLDENIVLPTTEEQALDHFLSLYCQDAYGVLGLKASCSEEDVRRHYKRLITLLNPEKNMLEGAEEAYIMVAKAYEALATPEARKMYNLSRIHPRKNDLHHEIGEMWDKVRLRIEEARSFMYCDCGRRHAKIALNVRQSEARYCRRCKTRHAARANDIWVETRLCGLLWVYFTCCDGIIYDITDWATCEINYLKHIRPNSHTVQYRLVAPTTSNSGKSATDATSRKKQNDKLHDLPHVSDECRGDWGM
ncbi:unnamed protein product [Angiostrongylus costaricensis]|uniref:J domain-containing protein n=1 Tax=Angiostrongylus costaricensis TaxID=334426 RepID=A0A0R3PGK2_ANGCS|nr:unnamed protein product [Angiostrongylus costaricensis]